MAQVTAISQTIRAIDAAGHAAAAHHPLQRVERADPAARRSSSDTLTEQQLFDYGTNFIRTQHRDRAGREIPAALRRQAAPDHGRPRPASALLRKGLSPRDVSNAINAQNLILPTGTAKIGEPANTPSRSTAARRPSPRSTTCRSRTVQRHDDLRPRRRPRARRLRRADEHRPPGRQALGVLLTILKNGDASHARHRGQHQEQLLPASRATLPQELKIDAAVRSVGSSCAPPIDGVVKEGVDRRGAHRPDDPALPRQLAQHADRRHLDPAVDPGLDHRP